ncbi:MAG TPA: hypothetical protein VIX82_07025 [Solirubrobacteraceae bacterium]
MSRAKLAAAPAVTALAIAFAGCGAIQLQPHAGSRGQIDSEATKNPDHLACMRGAGLPVTEVDPHKLQVGPLPTGPTVIFTPTPGAAQAHQIYGQAPGAEVIGSALVWVHQGSASELQAIEGCLAQGVTG